MQLRAVGAADREGVERVEAGSTPGLRYLGAMFDGFRADGAGEFMLVEDSGPEVRQVLGCAKFTVLPDGSAWLEALRVLPEAQGRGLGKRMYGRFFELARARGIHTMRMYTGLSNVVSAGLARQFGFALEDTFCGFTLPVTEGPEGREVAPFTPLRDLAQAETLLMPLQESWGSFVVLNRTFFTLTPALCAWLAQEGMVYASGGNVVVMGARFKPLPELHLGLWGGEAAACLSFAASELNRRGAQKLCCLVAHDNPEVKAALLDSGFGEERGHYIVMKVTL